MTRVYMTEREKVIRDRKAKAARVLVPRDADDLRMTESEELADWMISLALGLIAIGALSLAFVVM